MNTTSKSWHGTNSLRVGRVAWMVGLMACAAPARQAESRPLQAHAGGYEVEVLVDGAPARTYWHAGESFVLGHLGERYTIRVRNHTGRRVEAVVSVDGRDVIDGKPGDFGDKRGYLVPAWGSVDIDGWRVSQWQAAAFRFSSVADSYAGRMGSARNVGVIGVAIFPERVYRPPPRPIYPRPLWRDDYRRHEGGTGAAEDALGSAPAPRAAPGEGEAKSSGALAERSAESMAPRRSRPGLGTEFGEAVSSHVREVEFVRASSGRPAVVLGVRYNDRAGLLAMGVDVDGGYWPDDSHLRRTADPFPVSHRYARPPVGWNRY